MHAALVHLAHIVGSCLLCSCLFCSRVEWSFALLISLLNDVCSFVEEMGAVFAPSCANLGLPPY